MTSGKEFVDQAGDDVLRFISATKNLSRIGELADQVVGIARSSSWRRYQTAIGLNEWREAEFDYFLVACDLRPEDMAHVVLHVQDWATFAQIMDPYADATRRRTLEEAAKTWPAPSTESLVQRAQRLGWTRGSTTAELRPAPLPPRRRPSRGSSGKVTRQQSMLRRLAHEHPELYRRVLADEVSPYGAMREAGLLPKTITLNTDPEKAAQTLRRRLDKSGLERLRDLLQEPESP